MFTDYLKLSINNLLQRKTRSFLTIIGIVIGIMAVVALISIGQGLQESIIGQFEKIGSDRIIIQGGIMSYGGPGTGSEKLTQDDFEVIQDVPGVKTAAPVSFKMVEIEYKEREGIAPISAMHEDYVEEMFLGMDLYEIEKGDMPKKGNSGNICVGSRLASGDFWGEDGPEMDIRSKITLGETNFEKELRVNCIMKETGSPDDDSAIYMLMADFKEIFNEPADEYGVIFAKTKEGFDVDKVAEEIEEELKERLAVLQKRGKLLEAQRLESRTRYDMEMMREIGYCHGIENYSRHFTGRAPGEPPPNLMDYFSSDFLLFIDESHIAVPQLYGMYKGDRSRKQTLVEHGFRLPSALDNRPLQFEEFKTRLNQVVYVSATPADYEIEKGKNARVELIVRPTGLVDPEIDVRMAHNQVDDLLEEILNRQKKRERVLVTTLTKRMAEDLTEYFADLGIRVRYLHSDISTLERMDIIRDLRMGKFD